MQTAKVQVSLRTHKSCQNLPASHGMQDFLTAMPIIVKWTYPYEY